MTLVALSAAYGAMGSRIGPALAERLDVPFVDRAIPLAVAQRLDVPLDAAAAHDDQDRSSWIERVLRGFLGGDTGAPSPLPADVTSAEDFRRVTEEVVLQHAAHGAGVILGRASVVILREDPRVLRVRLRGPAERRLRQAMELQTADRDAVEQALRRADRTHAAYARRFYGADIDDPSLYHVILDATAIPVDAAVEIIATAARTLNVVTSPRD
jgi:Cytidylate kinase-like family